MSRMNSAQSDSSDAANTVVIYPSRGRLMLLTLGSLLFERLQLAPDSSAGKKSIGFCGNYATSNFCFDRGQDSRSLISGVGGLKVRLMQMNINLVAASVSIPVNALPMTVEQNTPNDSEISEQA